MNNKRPYGKAFAVPVQRKPFRTFPQNTTATTQPMVLYRTPSQFKSLTNPPQGRIWPEKKSLTLAGSIGMLGTGIWSELDFLNGIANGANFDQRVGRKIQLKSLFIRWNESSTAPSSNPLRILVVYDKAPEQALPTLLEVVTPNTFNAMNQLSNGDRFITLSDEIHQGIGSGSSTVLRAGTIYKKLNLPSVYIDASNTIADITTGAIFIACIYPFGILGNGIGYQSRVRYTDV